MSAATTGIDADTLALLTDEERAAIEDSEYSPEELAAMKGIAGEGEGEDDEDDDEESDGSEANSPPVEGEGAGEANDGDDGKGQDPKDELTPEPAKADESESAPRYQAELPADYQERVEKLKEDRAALKAQFKAGDIDFDEYNDKIEALDEQADELKDIKRRTDLYKDMNEQSAEQQWNRTLDTFSTEVKGVIDYRKDEGKLADLDDFIKRLAANPAHSDKSMRWFLDEAHKRVLALHDIKPAAAKKDDGEKPDPKKDRKPPVASAPQTLAQVPGSDGPGDVDGEFADLDGLDGLELEAAIARMTDAQRARYAQS
jgi:hypothetical protein